MSKANDPRRQTHPEGIIIIIGLFFFLALIGSIYSLMPTLVNDAQAFSASFHMVTVPNSSGLVFPAPANPGLYTTVYMAGEVFCIAWGVFSTFTLILRTVIGSAPWRKARSISGMFSWFGASYLIGTFLTVGTTLVTWFAFWAAIIMLIGGSLIIRGLATAALR